MGACCRVDILGSFLVVSDVSGRIGNDASPSVSHGNHDTLSEHGVCVSVLATLEHTEFVQQFFVQSLVSAEIHKGLTVLRCIAYSGKGTELLTLTYPCS